MLNKIEGMLSPYRVLDLTDEKGLMCGKLLGDLGADVIKVERPGGDPARNIGPFYHDKIDPEKSLFWWAFNTNKRGITLDIETAEGQEQFKKLVRTADFIIESFPPGYMESLGLGYQSLEEINLGIIMVSITPFGQTGPYKDYKASDIIAWAMGGVMYQYGDADRPPIRISHHSQAYLHASAEAAAAAGIALYHRKATGEGQHIDISIQESVVRTTFLVTSSWEMIRVNQRRGGPLRLSTDIQLTRIWPCKDGYIMWFYFGGVLKHLDMPFLEWMKEEGMSNDFLKSFDWDTLDWRTVDQGVVDRLEEAPRRFFLSHTKAELMEGALKYRVILYPISTSKDVIKSSQLADRGFWVDVFHPELDAKIKYPGAFIKATTTPPRITRRAPLIGEHNADILENELGLSNRTHASPEPAKTNIDSRVTKSVLQNKPLKPLQGIRIADFSWVYTGPLTTKTLADYGAEVVKIESTLRPDAVRSATPPYKDDIVGLNRSGSFNEYNTSKLSLSLNLAHSKGAEIAKKIVAWSDIVVENFAGGAMERMGLGYEELKKLKPDLIMLSTCMQGQTGPHSTHPGFGYHLTALSGVSQIAGWPDREPAWLGPYTDYIAPHFCVLTLLAALDYRRRTGEGQYFDMAQYETGVQFLAPLILDYIVNGRVANRMGNRSSYAAPHGAYRCRGEDRWCAIAISTDDEWRGFCRVLGDPDWTANSRFTTIAARKDNEDELDKLVEQWSIDHISEDVMTVLQTAGVGAGIVETGEDLLEHDPQLKFRNFFWEVDHLEIGKYRAPRPSFLLSKSSYELRSAPILGEHNDYVLKEILGISDEEIAELVIEGVFQ